MLPHGTREKIIVLATIVCIASMVLIGVVTLSHTPQTTKHKEDDSEEWTTQQHQPNDLTLQQTDLGRGMKGVDSFFAAIINDKLVEASTSLHAEYNKDEGGTVNNPLTPFNEKENKHNEESGEEEQSYRNLELPLQKPVVWHVPPTGGSPPVGETQQDLVVIPNPQNLPVFRPIRIRGYRHILIENLTLKPLADKQSAVAALTIERTTPGIVWIASSTIDTTRADMGAVLLDAPPSAQPIRLIIASSTLTVQDSKRKVGAFAWRGTLARFEARDSMIISDNVGLRLAPQAPTDMLEEALVRNTTLQRSHSRLEQARLLEVWSPSGSALRGVTLQNVRVVAQKGVPLGELVYPGHTTKDPSGAPIALRQVNDQETGKNFGVWIFTTSAGKAAVRGMVRYE